MKPLIGITLDAEKPGGYSKFPWYALRQNYTEAVAQAGGVPFPLPHHLELVDIYLEQLHGVIITGGSFDVNPALFGATDQHATVVTKEHRTAFEKMLICRALERKMPILGICGGQQLLNVVLGGTLIQHIPDEVPNCLAHEQSNPRNEESHTVSVTLGTQLSSYVESLTLCVNSAHHQAVKTVGPNVIINARAPDGVIEGIELKDYPFCIGVQWHPEFIISDADRLLYLAFIAAAEAYQHASTLPHGEKNLVITSGGASAEPAW